MATYKFQFLKAQRIFEYTYRVVSYILTSHALPSFCHRSGPKVFPTFWVLKRYGLKVQNVAKWLKTKSSATAEIARAATQSHSRSSVVVSIDAAYNYDFQLHSVSKNVPICFCQNFVKFPLILIVFGKKDSKEAIIMWDALIFHLT